jgi:hypothetical protein
MLADTPKDFKKQTVDVIGTDATSFKDDGYNGTATRAASLLTFVCPFPSPLSQFPLCRAFCFTRHADMTRGTLADNRSDHASLSLRSLPVSSEQGSSS